MRIKTVPQDIVNRLAVPPAVNDSVLPFFKPNPSSLNEWLETLPKCNPAETCRKILPAMETMNLTQLPGNTRFDLVECIRPYVFEHLRLGETALFDASFPLKPAIAEAVRFTINFQQALADAYKSVIVSDDFVSDRVMTEKKPDEPTGAVSKAYFSELEQATVIHRALQSIGMSLLRSAQSYQSRPEEIWGQVNALYALAESHSLHRTVVSDPECQRHPDSTIEDLFKQLHFFSLAIPNRFRQRDIQSIYLLLEDSARHIKISDSPGSSDKNASFFVDLNAARPAQHISKEAERNPATRFIHIHDFVEYIKSDQVVTHTKSELVNLDSEQIRLPARTIYRLLQCWHKISSRKFSRQAENRKVTLYPGLQNIIKKLLKVPDAEHTKGKMFREKKPQGLGSSLAHLELIPHENDNIYHSSADNLRSERSVESMLKSSKSNTSASDIWQQASRKKPSGPTQKVSGSVSDSSAKGYQLHVPAEKDALIKVGDLIGIAQDASNLEIAVIRHLSTQNDGMLALGVELIAPNAQVARIINADDNIRSRSVLMLPAIAAIQQPASVLSVSQLALSDNQLELMIDKQRSQYQITKLLETNPAFSHYTLDRLDS